MYLGHEAAKGLHDVSKGFTRSIASYCARLLRAMAVARKKAFLQRIRVRFYTFQAAIAKSSMADQTAAVSLPSKRDRSRKFQGSKCKWLWKC